MFSLTQFASLTLLVLGVSSCPCVTASQIEPEDRPILSTVVRAAACTMNATHCHCSYSAPPTGLKCLRQVPGEVTRCYLTDCRSGLKCDCGADTLCKRSEVASYKAIGDTSAAQFDCMRETKVIPRVVVGRTSDVDVLASHMFAMMINNDQKMVSSRGEYKVSTVELHAGDVVGVIARRLGQERYGIKVRFEDQDGNKRIIDSSWRCSDNYWSTWLSSSFDADANGWTAPNESTTMTGDGFDKDVPWMWLGDKETIFCRVVV